MPCKPPSLVDQVNNYMTAAVTALAAGNYATAVVNALIAAGVLQYVSGSSGPLQFTATAEANVPTPAQITTVEVIESNA